MMMMMVVVVVGDVLMSWPSAKDIQSLKWIIKIFPLILNIWEGGRDDIRGSPSTQEKEGEQASVSFSAGDFFLRISGCRMSVSRVQSAASNARVLGLSLDTVQMVAALPMEEFNVRMLYVLTPPFSWRLIQEVARGYRGEQKKILRDMRLDMTNQEKYSISTEILTL